MARNYLQRVAISAGRGGAAARPAALGPPPMPNAWMGVATRTGPPPSTGERTAEPAPGGAHDSAPRDARVEAPAPRPAVAAQAKPAAVLDRLLGPTPQTVVRVPRSLKPVKPSAPDSQATPEPQGAPVVRGTTARAATADATPAPIQPATAGNADPQGAPVPTPHLAGPDSEVGMQEGRGKRAERAAVVATERRADSAEGLDLPRPRLERARPVDHAAPSLAAPRKRENRISIGRVEVQVNNRPSLVATPSPPRPTAAGGDILAGQYLGRFALRP